MAQTATVTVQIDNQGRCYIPKAAREKLGIEGVSATADLEVRVDG
jgi:AbrB family looped-hinge helix DNA binding protein